MLMSRAYPCCCVPVYVPDRRSLGEGNSRSLPSGPLTPPFAGCTNPDAINYNPQAGQDDGSCIVAEDGPPAPEGGQELQGFISKACSIVLRGPQCKPGGWTEISEGSHLPHTWGCWETAQHHDSRAQCSGFAPCGTIHHHISPTIRPLVDMQTIANVFSGNFKGDDTEPSSYSGTGRLILGEQSV